MNKTKIRLKILNALSEDIRLRILELLRKKERTPTEIVKALGTTQPNISHHLRILEDSWIIKSKREGKKIIYSLSNKEIFKIFTLLDKMILEEFGDKT